MCFISNQILYLSSNSRRAEPTFKTGLFSPRTNGKSIINGPKSGYIGMCYPLLSHPLGTQFYGSDMTQLPPLCPPNRIQYVRLQYVSLCHLPKYIIDFQQFMLQLLAPKQTGTRSHFKCSFLWSTKAMIRTNNNLSSPFSWRSRLLTAFSSFSIAHIGIYPSCRRGDTT